MTMLFENRTISMILTVPNGEVGTPSLSHSLDKRSFSFSNYHVPTSIPIYHGSIIHIEQHCDNHNTSDLIVRVPNFHHLSLPSVTISDFDHPSKRGSQREGHNKRRAPICPTLNGSLHRSALSNRNTINDLNLNQPDNNSRQTNTKRLATGLRSLSRIFITNCKSKRSSSIGEITIIPVLPDVEVITGGFDIPRSAKKSNQNQNASKFITPKILFIKRKNFKIKKKQSSSTSIETEDDTTIQNTTENSPTNLSFEDNENEPKHTIPIRPDRAAEQQSTTIAQLVSNIPILLSNPESPFTHCAYTISEVPQIIITEDISSTKEIQNPFEYEDEPSSNIDQTVTLAHLLAEQNIDSASDIQSLVPIDNSEERVYVVHPNGETFSECYEITYELDPQYRNEQIYLSQIQNQSSLPINIHFNPFEYQDLPAWLSIFPNNYEQVEDSTGENDRTFQNEDRDLAYGETPITTNITRVKFRSLEDLSQKSNDQQPESVSTSSSSQENDINEDYTVILQFIKNALQMDIVNFDVYNEFKGQIDQLFQSDQMNELE